MRTSLNVVFSFLAGLPLIPPLGGSLPSPPEILMQLVLILGATALGQKFSILGK